MKKLSLLLAALLLALALTGCSSAKESITVYNWEDYICPEALELFTEETGITVKYVRFTTNEEMYIKLSRGGSSYDVAFPSDYMIERMIANDMLMELDHSKLSNFDQNAQWLQDPDYDRGSRYSAPYMWGTVGILYNTKMVEGGSIDSWGAMWDTQYQRNVLMMDSVRDSLGVTLCYLGYDLNTRELSELEAARDKLIEQRESGVLLAYGVDEIKDKMANNEAAMGLVWSGDAITSIDINPDLAYCVPKEGSNIWVDGMVIPKTAKNYEGALKFIDFMMRPDIAAMNSEYIGYSTPNQGALTLLDDELVNDPTFNPPQDVIDRCTFFHDVEDVIDMYDRIWVEVTAN